MPKYLMVCVGWVCVGEASVRFLSGCKYLSLSNCNYSKLVVKMAMVHLAMRYAPGVTIIQKDKNL